MRLIPRVLAVVIMLAAMFLLIRNVKELTEAGDPNTGEQITMSEQVSYYVCILGLAAATAVVSCVSLLPLLGEFAGNLMFTPNEKIERSAHHDAMVRLAARDFQGAADEYRTVFEDDPEDLHAASEVVRLYCEKLHNPDPAADFLVEALSYSDRSPESIAFLSERLVDVCWHHQHDGIRARAILSKIAQDMPETREGANALHRLKEIERIMNQDVHLATEQASEDPAVAAAEAEPVEKPPEGAPLA